MRLKLHPLHHLIYFKLIDNFMLAFFDEATCTVASASDTSEKCVPMIGFMTVGCDGENQSECEDLIAAHAGKGMDENSFVSDEIVRVAWVGSRIELMEAPPPPANTNSIVSLETQDDKSYVALSVIIAAAVACTLALLAFWARKKKQKEAEPGTTDMATGAEETVHDRNLERNDELGIE
uniref:Uncharacterized protein n=1 Tax=Odontella aurita TaxID=265563 RepID=A0A7S4MQ05_9STRA|mmetsp:Transcript_28198/g.83097  ORF Transcript_28198/g.83097 Transcript_28198/m.83097 type:complete len:179 (+) Transcript_28198:70-606(+)